MPIHLIAADMLSGQEVLLSAGPLIDAVLASAAIPGVYPPAQIDGRWLIDGGVANNMPISVAIGFGATCVSCCPPALPARSTRRRRVRLHVPCTR